MGRLVCGLDRQIVTQPDETRREDLGQIAGVVGGLLGIPAGILRLLQGHPDTSFYVVPVGRAGHFLEPLDGTTARHRQGERPGEQHGQRDDEENFDRVHKSSMAQPAKFG